MGIYKHCPYCIKRLGFFSIVKQRILAKDKDALKCPECESVISTSGNAKISLLVGGSAMIGYAFGYMVSNNISMQWFVLLASVAVGVIIFLLLVYYLAPIRKA
jgi:uncharacterized membrane protein YvbJ